MKSLFIAAVLSNSMMLCCLAQGPRKYLGSTTTTNTPHANSFKNAIRHVKSKCQVCLTIKSELNKQTPTDTDICDESDALYYNADTFLCNSNLSSKKVITKRSIEINEIE